MQPLRRLRSAGGGIVQLTPGMSPERLCRWTPISLRVGRWHIRSARAVRRAWTAVIISAGSAWVSYYRQPSGNLTQAGALRVHMCASGSSSEAWFRVSAFSLT